jgi:tetratricopeptide (TPR) repeat protein
MVNIQGNEDLFRRSMNQGHSAAWENRWKEAVEHYSRALEQFPDNAPTINNLAFAHLQLGQQDQALNYYNRAMQLTPDDPLPVEKIAQIYKELGNLEEVVSYSLRAAELHLKLKDADKAINNWTRVTLMTPENIDAHAKLAFVYEKLGRISQAIAEYIALAAISQRAGKQEQALKYGENALKLDPRNKEAQEAVAMLKALTPLPAPVRQRGLSGPLRLPVTTGTLIRKAAAAEFKEGSNPVEETAQRSIQVLANMLFDLSPGETKPTRKTSGLRSIAEGFLARGFDEKAIVLHLSRAIDMQTLKRTKEAAEELSAAIEAGLDHPAAHFNLGMLLSKSQPNDAYHSFQDATRYAEYAMPAWLLMGNLLTDQKRHKDAVSDYLQALKWADLAVVDEGIVESLKQAYDPWIDSFLKTTNDKEIKQLSTNIRNVLQRSNWRMAISEARGQLPAALVSEEPVPIAEVLTDPNSGRLVDALARISQLSRDGYLRAAMEEAYTALAYSPAYLPLHIQMGELLLMNDRPQQAIEKLSAVARVYEARGDSNSATQTYERIVSVSPLDVAARNRLIEQLTAHDQKVEAARQYLELADVYYRLAQLDKARDTYEMALQLIQMDSADPSWSVKILHQMADIDMQRLDWRKALGIYEQIRSLDHTDRMSRQNLAVLNLRLGNEAKASLELEGYLQSLDPNDVNSDAGNFLQTLVDENPRFLLGHRRLAEQLQQNNQKDEAIREWNKVGELLVESGDREGAKAAVRAILAMNPPNAQRYQQFLDRLSK